MPTFDSQHAGVTSQRLNLEIDPEYATIRVSPTGAADWSVLRLRAERGLSARGEGRATYAEQLGQNYELK